MPTADQLTGGPFFSVTKKPEVVFLLNAHHYIGAQCADPSFTCVWRRPGGLFGDCGDPCAAALFAPPASFAWGDGSIELVRLVRDETEMPPLTMFVSECLSVVRQSRKYRLVIAYADPAAGHHGGIYQAGNWLYVGQSSAKVVYIHRESGKHSSQRSFAQSNYDASEWDKVPTGKKATYVYPLTREARRQWTRKAKTYPKPRDFRQGECRS